MANDRVMPGDGLGRILSAAATNRKVEAAEAQAAGRVNNVPTPAREVRTNWCIAKVANSSGGARARWEVVQVGAKLLTTFDPGDPAFYGGLVGDTLHSYAILQQPLAEDDIDPAARVAGWSMAKVTVGDATHARATVVASSASLASCSTGGQFRLLNPSGATGAQECMVLFDDSGTAPAFGGWAYRVDNQVEVNGTYTIMPFLNSVGGAGYGKGGPGFTDDATNKITCVTAGTYPVWLSLRVQNLTSTRTAPLGVTAQLIEAGDIYTPLMTFGFSPTVWLAPVAWANSGARFTSTTTALVNFQTGYYRYQVNFFIEGGMWASPTPDARIHVNAHLMIGPKLP